jgi:diguanylate cyclase (GGDEF)-like protein
MFSGLLQSLCFLLPPTPSLETTSQRERYRKARLLSIVIIVSLLLTYLPVVSYALTGPYLAELFLFPGICAAIGALLINRADHLEAATLLFLLVIVFEVLSFAYLEHSQQNGTLWVMYATLPTTLASLFLPAWMPWIFGLFDGALFTVMWCFPQALPWLEIRSIPPSLLTSIYFLFFLSALVGSLTAWSIERAIAQADRSAELELANRRLLDANEELRMIQEELTEHVAALKSANARLDALATTDPLTELPNHRAMARNLKDEIERARRHDRPLAVLFCDLDYFKSINDRYGHSSGDDVLQAFAQLAQATLRQHDIVGRWGGEEFVVILPEMDEPAAVQCAERLRMAVASQLFQVSSTGIHITCSIGVACYPQDGAERSALVDAADRAMYSAKQSGRNRVCRASQLGVQHLQSPAPSHEVAEMVEIVDALAALLESQDGDGGEHRQAIASLVEEVAQEMGCSPEDRRIIGLAARLRDLRRAEPSDAPRQESERFPLKEQQETRAFAAVGADLMARFPGLPRVVAIIQAQYERWDGWGYPEGLSRDAIPVGARIVATVNAYDALVMDRSSQAAPSTEQALEALGQRAGTEFDPQAVAALMRVLAKKERAKPAA